ncbi:MAG: bifunctional adenosylcobinamide kinase/adenosylcobinamide-phosphate guanylyltransferase [Ilumatobacter sp.]
MSLTLLIGGARSGKSSLAVDIGHRRHGDDQAVTYIATAPVIDADMADRIERHREERPASWSTIEEEVDLADAIHSVTSGLVIVDCLTLWTSNLMFRELSDTAIVTATHDAVAAATGRPGETVVITNEVGLGIHPETDLGRRYRDTLGRVNQTWAGAAERSLLLVAGRALPLGDPWDHLPSN